MSREEVKTQSIQRVQRFQKFNRSDQDGRWASFMRSKVRCGLVGHGLVEDGEWRTRVSLGGLGLMSGPWTWSSGNVGRDSSLKINKGE